MADPVEVRFQPIAQQHMRPAGGGFGERVKMHDTAFHIGTLAMNIYADLRTDSILEVGSQAFNGSLRDNALPSTRYVGIDIEEGEGVDVVIEPGKSFPVDEGAFDLVMATSVFEHDPCFWMTFLEMCRAAKDGGYIYINAPSNGVVHRYPQDNWRFYPDSGRALSQWATSQGCPVTLVESFVANREKDIWNDFVAVFRKGPIKRKLPNVFLHEHVRCTDVLTWKSKEIINPSEQPEDMILLRDADERARVAEEELAKGSAERQALAEEGARLRSQLAEAANTKAELNLIKSELRQRQEEIEQTRSKLAQAQSAVTLHQRECLDLQQRLTDFERLRSEHQAAMADLESARHRLATRERRIDELVASLGAAQSAKSELERRLAAHFHETATLSRIILDNQQSVAKESEKARRIMELYDAVVREPRWWSILPRSQRSRLQKTRLQRLGLFDWQSYLRANPDVATAGEDPLHHFIHHGLDEQRPI